MGKLWASREFPESKRKWLAKGGMSWECPQLDVITQLPSGTDGMDAWRPGGVCLEL